MRGHIIFTKGVACANKFYCNISISPPPGAILYIPLPLPWGNTIYPSPTPLGQYYISLSHSPEAILYIPLPPPWGNTIYPSPTPPGQYNISLSSPPKGRLLYNLRAHVPWNMCELHIKCVYFVPVQNITKISNTLDIN